MTWTIEYFEEADGAIPGDLFEEELNRSRDRDTRRLLTVLKRWIEYAVEQGPLGGGGGHFEKCRDVAVWQVKASQGSKRGRWFFGWDEQEERLVLLSGIVKDARTSTPAAAYERAENEWKRYMKTRRIAEEEM